MTAWLVITIRYKA